MYYLTLHYLSFCSSVHYTQDLFICNWDYSRATISIQYCAKVMQASFAKIPGFLGFRKKFCFKQYFIFVTPSHSKFLNNYSQYTIIHGKFLSNNSLLWKILHNFSNNNSWFLNICHNFSKNLWIINGLKAISEIHLNDLFEDLKDAVADITVPK